MRRSGVRLPLAPPFFHDPHPFFPSWFGSFLYELTPPPDGLITEIHFYRFKIRLGSQNQTAEEAHTDNKTSKGETAKGMYPCL